MRVRRCMRFRGHGRGNRARRRRRHRMTRNQNVALYVLAYNSSNDAYKSSRAYYHACCAAIRTPSFCKRYYSCRVQCILPPGFLHAQSVAWCAIPASMGCCGIRLYVRAYPSAVDSLFLQLFLWTSRAKTCASGGRCYHKIVPAKWFSRSPLNFHIG